MPFASARQRKKVMALLRQEGFRDTPQKVTIEGQHYRARIREPNLFKGKSFRTLDVGKQGGIKLIIGRPKSSMKTKTQSIIIKKSKIGG